MKKIAVWSAGMTVLLSLLAPLASPAQPQAPAAQFIETTVQPREAFGLIQKNKDNPQFVVLMSGLPRSSEAATSTGRSTSTTTPGASKP